MTYSPRQLAHFAHLLALRGASDSYPQLISETVRRKLALPAISETVSRKSVAAGGTTLPRPGRLHQKRELRQLLPAPGPASKKSRGGHR